MLAPLPSMLQPTILCALALIACTGRIDTAPLREPPPPPPSPVPEVCNIPNPLPSAPVPMRRLTRSHVERAVEDVLGVTRSLQVQRLLASRSQRGRKIPDLLVAAAAESLNLIVLHYDADFDLISAVTEQQCQWVVAAGSID